MMPVCWRKTVSQMDPSAFHFMLSYPYLSARRRTKFAMTTASLISSDKTAEPKAVRMVDSEKVVTGKKVVRHCVTDGDGAGSENNVWRRIERVWNIPTKDNVQSIDHIDGFLIF